MDKIKEFIINNKILMITIGSIALLAIIIITVLVGADNGDKNKQTETTTSKVVQNSTEETTTPEESETTVEIETTTDITTTETTTQEQTTEPETTGEYVPVEYPYLIMVNRAANCTTVYAKDANGQYTIPYKAITVSCGKNIEDTPLGQYNTIISYDWRLMFDGTYGHYAYRIVGSTLFHSVPFYTASNDNLEWQEYNKLGSPASLGCVRMTVADAKWLVENCPVGTTVIIYDDASNPGPLGKPDTIKIPEDSPYRGWDPTDPNPNNPWHQFTATIEYPASKSVTIEAGSSINSILANFSAKDTCGNDISEKLQVSGQYDLNVAGNYNIVVSVTDAIGRYAEVNVTLTVKEKVTVPTTTKPVTTAPTTTNPVTTEPTTPVPTTAPTTTETTTMNSSETNQTDENATEGEQNTTPM